MTAIIGYRIAQLGAALMIIGGAVDSMVRTLLPHHVAAFGGDNASVPEPAAQLLLAMLHALGGALIAGGIAVLLLLHLGRKHDDRFPFIAAMFIVVLAEGPNALGIYRANSPLYIGPVVIMVLVIVGSLL